MSHLPLNAAGMGTSRGEARRARSWLRERWCCSQGKESCQNQQFFAPECCKTGTPQAGAMEEDRQWVDTAHVAATLALNKDTQFKYMPIKE